MYIYVCVYTFDSVLKTDLTGPVGIYIYLSIFARSSACIRLSTKIYSAFFSPCMCVCVIYSAETGGEAGPSVCIYFSYTLYIYSVVYMAHEREREKESVGF